MRLYRFLVMAAIALSAYVDVSSNRSRSTFVTSITSDEPDISAQRFLRDDTEANEEERTNGRIYLVSTMPFLYDDGVEKTLLWHLRVRENSVDDTFFLDP